MILLVMPFRNRNRNTLRPINRIKHVVDKQSAVGLGVAESSFLVITKDDPILANPEEVQTGCTINGVYLKLEANATTSAALSNFYMIVFKNPGGTVGNPVPNAVGAFDNKRFVIHQEMVMFQQQTNSNPRTVFNGVIVIPKGYRRFGPNDLLTVRVLSPGVNVNYCLQCHYKEFR